jgi:hypothetical protein
MQIKKFSMCKYFPVTILAKAGLTINEFAILRAYFSRVPELLLQHGFLISLEEGSTC